MLKFILGVPGAHKDVERNSNTSHVKVYLPVTALDSIFKTHSNTSHVKVYQTTELLYLFLRTLFKYISC